MINTDAVTESIRKAIAKNGEDYVYPQPGGSCLYVFNGEPSCLVGFVIDDLFPDKIDAVAQFESSADDTDFRHLQEAFQFPLTQEAEQLLEDVQAYQDSRKPWGQALDLALNER